MNGWLVGWLIDWLNYTRIHTYRKLKQNLQVFRSSSSVSSADKH